jgi:hypothetical protein
MASSGHGKCVPGYVDVEIGPWSPPSSDSNPSSLTPFRENGRGPEVPPLLGPKKARVHREGVWL